VLETKDLTIRFGGHVAVDRVSCAFRPGTLTAIVGPNGAGKTTYFNLISGQLRASEGQVLLDGVDLSRMSAPQRTKAGLGRAFQLTQLFPHLTVLENVRLAVQARRGMGLRMLSVWLSHRALIDEAMAIVERVRLGSRAQALAASLPHGDQRKLEVAMLIALDPKVYMFDEPTAGMSKTETSRFIHLIKEVTEGRTLLTVEHDMGVVFGLADKIAVVVYGEVIAFDVPDAVRANQRVQEAYLGSVVADEQGAGH